MSAELPEREERSHEHAWPQRCKACGRADGLDFNVEHETWARVVPTEFQNRVVCLPCFDYFASAKNINYIEALRPEIYFSGSKGSFIARIEHKNFALPV